MNFATLLLELLVFLKSMYEMWSKNYSEEYFERSAVLN